MNVMSPSGAILVWIRHSPSPTESSTKPPSSAGPFSADRAERGGARGHPGTTSRWPAGRRRDGEPGARRLSASRRRRVCCRGSAGSRPGRCPRCGPSRCRSGQRRATRSTRSTRALRSGRRSRPSPARSAGSSPRTSSASITGRDQECDRERQGEAARSHGHRASLAGLGERTPSRPWTAEDPAAPNCSGAPEGAKHVDVRNAERPASTRCSRTARGTKTCVDRPWSASRT